MTTFNIYGIPKDDDMSDGHGRKMPVSYKTYEEAEEYVERNTSPDNWERYEIRPDEDLTEAEEASIPGYLAAGYDRETARLTILANREEK